jgi:hypothetical protein
LIEEIFVLRQHVSRIEPDRQRERESLASLREDILAKLERSHKQWPAGYDVESGNKTRGSSMEVELPLSQDMEKRFEDVTTKE